MTRPNLLVVTEPAARCGCAHVEHERDSLAAHIEYAHVLYLKQSEVEMVADTEQGMYHPVDPVMMAEWDEWYRTAPAESLRILKDQILTDAANRVLARVRDEDKAIEGLRFDGTLYVKYADLDAMLCDAIELILEGE